MAIDSLTGSAANQINPASVANRPAPDAAERGRDKDKDNAAQVQAAQSNPPPPPNRGQSVDIKV